MKEVDITGLPSDNSESHIGLSEELYRIQEQNVKEHQDVSVYFEHSDESYRITELYQRFPMDEALRDVVRSSDFTAYVDLVGDSLEFKDQLVKLSYIKNWFDFSFKQLVANPNQRPLQLYSYPELQQAVYYGNLIRELVTKDCFVNMWSSLLPNVGLGGLPIG
ncbi:MAG: hypothetical protein U9Q76_09525, partial [candidate division WOR-3 bacterium]|nr:hypothetical protein [candidate division WOR-3 bacterium]